MPCLLNSFFTKSFFTLITCCFVFANTIAQQTSFTFSPLGSDFYKEKISQLEKYSVPKKYSDKSSQAWYEEILTDRNKDLLSSFKDNDVIYDTLLLTKCNSILNRIAATNKNYNFDSIKLYINRSMVANAACWGDGTIMINLGLFLWIDNDDELAVVIGHEIAHQLLNHFNSAMEKRIAVLTSDDFKAELKSIKKADYGKLERFRNLMKGLQVEAGKHSRYKESEADSFGVLLAKNANFNINNGARVLLKLNNVDQLFTSRKLYVLKDYFEKAPIDQSYFTVKTKYHGLSSAAVTMNADQDLDSIKTHPDCVKRFESINGKTTDTLINCCSALTLENNIYKQHAMLEIVRHLYENNALGLCTHLCLFALKNNYDPVIYNDFLSLCFSRLYNYDKNLKRFTAANTYASRETNLKEIQDLLFALNSKDLDALANYFLNYKANAGSEDFEFANLMYNTEVKLNESETAYTAFNKKFPKNKYQYLIQKK